MTAPTYMSALDLAEYLRLTGVHRRVSAQRWIKRNGVRRYWRGTAALVKRADVDAVLAGEQQTERA